MKTKEELDLQLKEICKLMDTKGIKLQPIIKPDLLNKSFNYKDYSITCNSRGEWEVLKDCDFDHSCCCDCEGGICVEPFYLPYEYTEELIRQRIDMIETFQ